MLAAVLDAANHIIFDEKLIILSFQLLDVDTLLSNTVLAFKPTAWKRDCLLLSNQLWDSTTVLAIFEKTVVGFWSFWLALQSASLSPIKTGFFAFDTNLSFDVAWTDPKILFGPLIWVIVGTTMKRDGILTPYKISRRVCLARNRSDSTNFRYDVASANSSLSSALPVFSLTFTGNFSGL